MAKTLNVYLSDDKAQKLKALAFATGKSMSAIIADLIETAPSPDGKWYKEWVKEQKSKEAKK